MKVIDASKIKELRLKKGLSQRELGEVLGVSDQAISKWEKGQSQPSAMHLINLTRVFDIDADVLLPESVRGIKKNSHRHEISC